jgi:hypothetical protein
VGVDGGHGALEVVIVLKKGKKDASHAQRGGSDEHTRALDDDEGLRTTLSSSSSTQVERANQHTYTALSGPVTIGYEAGGKTDPPICPSGSRAGASVCPSAPGLFPKWNDRLCPLLPGLYYYI